MQGNWYYTVFFVFSILSLIKLGFGVVSNFLSDEPKKLKLTTNETIFYGVCMSYFITYLFH
jgi:hypothetical protein